MRSENFIFLTTHPSSSVNLQQNSDWLVRVKLPKVDQLFWMRTIGNILMSWENLIILSVSFLFCSRNQGSCNQKRNNWEFT